MSADNGIYILRSNDGWRVAHLQCIENIYDGNGFDLEYLKNYFDYCEVFNNPISALKEAQRQYQDIMNSDFPIVEYGIQEIYYDGDFPE